MAGRMSRNKGARGEREFFTLLNKFLPERLRFQRELAQTRDGGSDGSSAYVAIAVKRCEKTNLPAWLAQVRTAAQPCQTPVLAYRQNHGKWNILVDMDPREFAAYLRWKPNLTDTENNIRDSQAQIAGK